MACRFALYASNSVCLLVGAIVSNTTPMCVGCWLFSTSSNVFTNPKTADVLKPAEVRRGVLLNAKYALYIKAIPSNRNNFFTQLVNWYRHKYRDIVVFFPTFVPMATHVAEGNPVTV